MCGALHGWVSDLWACMVAGRALPNTACHLPAPLPRCDSGRRLVWSCGRLSQLDQYAGRPTARGYTGAALGFVGRDLCVSFFEKK